MEDRIAERGDARGVSLAAFGAIAAISAAWWALALWPAGANAPEWLARTRAACFGAARGGLPDAGGWILLVGEPAGMAAMLWLMYGRALRDDVRWVRARPVARAVTGLFVAAMLLIVGLTGERVVRAWARFGPPPAATQGAVRLALSAPNVPLVDQYGRLVSIADLSKTVIVTFAYGHCTTVCPLTVAALREARNARRMQMPLVVVTVDPWRDTPDRLPTIARSWSLSADDLVLSGSVADVTRVLDAFGIGRRRDDVNGEVEHAASALLVRPGGRVTWRIDGPPTAFASLLTLN